MLYAPFFFVYSFFYIKKRPVSWYLLVFISISSLAGILIGNTGDFDDFLSLFNLLFTIFILVIMCSGFKNYRTYDVSAAPAEYLFKCLIALLMGLLFCSLFVNILIVSKSFNYIVMSSSDITAFKNEGEAAVLIRQWVNPYLVMFANFVSPLGILALAFHFYFMVKQRLIFSIIFLILSLNIPLAGLHGLSRGAIVQFLLVYFFYYCYLYPAISSHVRLRINLISLAFGLLVFYFFYYITDSRFSDSSYYAEADDSFIKNRALFSIFDYFSQWIPNGLIVMREFTLEKLWFGSSSFVLIKEVLARFGLDIVTYSDLRSQTLAGNASSFNGLVATLLYDFSYIGVVVFALAYYFFVRFLEPKNGVVTLPNLIWFGSLVTVPAMFFTNNYLSNIIFNVGLFYTAFIYLLLRFRFVLR